jgi:hypothetical protein
MINGNPSLKNAVAGILIRNVTLHLLACRKNQVKYL